MLYYTFTKKLPLVFQKESIISAANKFMLFLLLLLLLLLPKSLEVPNMSAECISERCLVVVPDAKLLARFTYNRSYLWVVNLAHTWEQVMGGLMVKTSWEWNRTLLSTTDHVVVTLYSHSSHHFILCYIPFTG